jgi:hypothetical protein
MTNETPDPEVTAVEASTESIWIEPAVVRTSVAPSASGNSIVALVLSITSWVVCPIVFAIVALVFAHKAEKEISASNGSVGGGAFVTASKIVAWINIGVYSAVVILGIIGLFFLTILGVSGN